MQIIAKYLFSLLLASLLPLFPGINGDESPEYAAAKTGYPATDCEKNSNEFQIVNQASECSGLSCGYYSQPPGVSLS